MHPHLNRFELENFAKTAAQAYLDGGVGLNETITKMAREHSFTEHHVERVAQNANILVNGALVTRARSDGDDPRVTFEMAKSADINGGLQTDDDGDMQKAAEVIDLFKVKPQKAPNVIDRVLGKTAADPYAQHPKSVDHMQMAEAFVREPQMAEKVAGAVDSQSLSLVCQTLEDLENNALSDHNVTKLAMSETETGLRDEIHDQLLSGMAPATVREVIKHAELNKKVADYVDKLVTKVAAKLQLREGQSAFVNGSLTNAQHPLIVKSAAVMDKVDEAVRTHRGMEKLSSAHQSARVQYRQAVREKRC